MNLPVRSRGFTWMEVGLLVTISALVVALVKINRESSLIICTDEQRVWADLNTLKVSLDLYQRSTGDYPTAAQGFQALVSEPEAKPNGWRKMFEAVPNDPWGNPYVYERPGKKHPDSYDIYSAGKDGQLGTPDDIWPK